MTTIATKNIRIGDTITFRELTFRNTGGGTQRVQTKLPVPGKVTAIVHDDECGNVLHCEPSLAARLMVGDKQHAEDKRVFVREFNVLFHKQGGK